jgi:hypothetical protein
MGRMSTWSDALTLNTDNSVRGGSGQTLAAAIGRGADLRLYLEFRHDEHLEPGSDIKDVVQDVVDLRVTYLIEDRWSAGIMTQKLPMNMPHGWGPRASMSFFMCNQDNFQSSARPYLDGTPATGTVGPSPSRNDDAMPKIRYFKNWDAGTNAPSFSFTYEYEVTRFIVNDVWQEVFAHDAEGHPTTGSRKDLVDAFAQGCEIKVGIRGLCADLQPTPLKALDHEVFVQVGASYHYPRHPRDGSFMSCSQPVVRCRPQIPLVYESRGWDFGWLMPRTDGTVFRWLVDPYTLQFQKSEGRYPVRWFVR